MTARTKLDPRIAAFVVVVVVVVAPSRVHAQVDGGVPPPPIAEPEPEPEVFVDEEDAPFLSKIDIHGFVSQGGFVSTANDYIGTSSRGSLAFFEAGLNVSTQVAERLRAGVQLFARRVGDFDDPVKVDWAFVDYAWKPQLGLRAGVIKIPLGLYNEYQDIDSARLPILLPQAVYPLSNREAVVSHTGLSIYGTAAVPGAGELEYQAFLGTLTIPANALQLIGATLEGIDTKYVTGAQVFWRPIEELRIGASYQRASIDFNLRLAPATLEQLIMLGLVPADYDGLLVVSQRPTEVAIGSIEYVRGDWLFAAEYSRWLKHQQTSLPALVPAFDEDAERFYALAAYRLSPRVEVGGYYAAIHLAVGDRAGRDPQFPERHHGFQRDLAATLRYDVNDQWLWKLEAHFIDGAADLTVDNRPGSERYWGLALFKTTVTF